jgi:hypothetical protein
VPTSEGGILRRIAWARTSAWATVAHIFFQVAALVLRPSESLRGWGVSTLAQMAVAAILGFGAFRGNRFALTILAILGGLRLAALAGLVVRLLQGTAGPIGTRLWLEYATTAPIAILWMMGGIAALRFARSSGER